jgi:NADPH:quinone reductase-like Zn-dependent oxidoreductase
MCLLYEHILMYFHMVIKMKAIVLKDFGGPEQLQLETVPTPQPDAHEVLVRIEAAGVCHHDLMHRAGKLPGAHRCSARS